MNLSLADTTDFNMLCSLLIQIDIDISFQLQQKTVRYFLGGKDLKIWSVFET